MAYRLVAPYPPAGDQPQAIAELVAGLESGERHQTLLGVTGSGKTFTIANVIARYGKPALIISHNKTLAAQLYAEFRQFFPENAVGYFISYYDYYQPEAYVPLPDGRSIPVTMNQSSSGGGDVFNISVNVAEGGVTSSAGQGKDLGRAISSAVRQELLNQKRAGGLLDPVEGGFYRYATRADWSVPHYEKMLQGNAELLWAASELYASTQDPKALAAAQSISSYLSRSLWSEQAGALWASQDADETYSRLDAAGRAKAKAPVIDHTFLADRLGLAAFALARASALLGEPSLGRMAQRSVDLVLTRMRSQAVPGAVCHALVDAPGAQPQHPGLLADQASLVLALVEVAGQTGERRYLDEAEKLAGFVLQTLAAPGGAGFVDQPSTALKDAVGRGTQPLIVRKDHVESGRYKTLADLKGFKIAVSAPGTSAMPCAVTNLAVG